MIDEKKQSINEEAGLPENWVPVDSPAIIPGAGGSRPDQPSGDRFLGGSLPENIQLPTDFAKTASKSPTAPNLSLIPLGLNTSWNNAAIQSIIEETAAATAAAVVSGVTWKGIWSNFVIYPANSVVLYNNSAYINPLKASINQEPDINSSVWQVWSKNLNFRGRWNPGYVQSARVTLSANPVTATFASGNTAGNSILVYLSFDRGTTGLTVTYTLTDTQGNTYKQIGTVVSGSSIYTAIFLATGIIGGSSANSLTATAAGGGSVGSAGSNIVASEYTAVAFIGEDETGSATTTNFTGSISASVSPTGSGDLLVVFASLDNDSPIDPPLGYALRSATVTLPSAFQPFTWDNQVNSLGQTVTLTTATYIGSTPAVLRLVAMTPSTTPLYYPADVVYFGNSFWVCTSQTRTQPSLTSTVWTLLAQGAGGVVSTAISTGYTASDSDYGKLLTFSGSGNGTLNLPSYPPEVSWCVSVNNYSTGVLGITAGSTTGAAIDGSTSTIFLLPNTGCQIFTDGFNYFTMRGGASSGVGFNGVNSQTGNYLAVAGDTGKLITFSSGSALTLTLPATPPNSNWWIYTQCVGAGGLTVARNGKTIDGSAANLTLTQTQGVFICTDGSNYFTERGVGGGSGGGGINAQTGTTYTVLSTDLGKLITFTNASAIAVTLPVASTSGFGASWYTDVQNIGAVGQGWVTITPTTSTIDGAATLVVQAGSGARIFSDGTNYFTDRGAASLSLDNLTDSWPGRESQFYRPAQFTTDVCIDNACFEASTVMVNGAPPGWYNSYLTSGYTALSFNTASPFIGDRSLRITGVTGTSGGACAQNRVITVVPGETYQVSGWIKTDGSCTGSINLILTNYPISAATEISATSAASSWTYVSQTGTVPTGYGSGGYCLGILQLNSAGGTGTSVCDFDNIRIHRIFGASGTYSNPGMVPDPGATAGTSRFLREDASWQNPTFSGTDITLAAIDLTGQTSSIVAANFANTGTGLAAGMYIAQIFVDVTTAGSAGTLTTTIAYTTDSGSDSQTTATTSLATLGTNSGFTIPFYAAANSAISYATTVASVIGSPVYTLHIRLIQVATTAVLYAAGGVNSQTANYLAVAGDMGKLITMNGSSLTLTLPATPPSSLWWCSVENTNASSLTLSPNSLDIDGSASSITVAQNTGLAVFTDGTNYFTMRGIGGGGGGGGTNITVNGGSALSSPVNFQNGTNTVVTNPSGSNVQIAANCPPLPNTSRWFYFNADGSAMFASGTGSFSSGGMSLTIANPGSGGFGFNAFAGPYVSAYSPSGALADFCTGNAAGLTKPFYQGNNCRFQTELAMYNSTGHSTASIFWWGFSDQTPTTMGASANPAGNYACFRYVAGTDTNIQCVTKDGTTQTVTDSGVPPTTGFLASTATMRFEIKMNDGTPNVQFYINGTLVATNTTHLPTSATAMNWQATCKSASSIGVGPSLSYVYFESAY